VYSTNVEKELSVCTSSESL